MSDTKITLVKIVIWCSDTLWPSPTWIQIVNGNQSGESFWNWQYITVWELWEYIGNDISARVKETGGVILFYKQMPVKDVETFQFGKGKAFVTYK